MDPATDPVGFAARTLETRIPRPEVFCVLGSGLAPLVNGLDGSHSVPVSALGLPEPTVAGHQGRFIHASVEGRSVLFQVGRYHLYEGHAPQLLGLPVRIAHAVGARTLIVTNAAGGLDLGPGSLMAITDHLNLMGTSPLIGPVGPEEARFPDMSAAYDPALLRLADAAAERAGVELEKGVYAAVHGPAYETPAEVRMLGTLGADAVGMSTVPEVLTARALGMRVLGLSLITNHAAGTTEDPLSHEEVIEAGREAGGRLEALVRGVFRGLDEVGVGA